MIIAKSKGGHYMLYFKFDWDSRIELKIPSIDEQHQYLFKLGRRVEQLLIVRCAGVTDQELLNLLCGFRDYVTYHFYEEEKFMTMIQYPYLKEHHEAHLRMLSYINHIDYTLLCEHPFEQLSLIRDELVRWIFDHMIQEDQKILPYYEAYQKTLNQEKDIT